MTQTPHDTSNEQENEMRMNYPGVSSLALEDDGLTYKQRLFLEAYLGDAKGNATKAAKLAGYAGDRSTLTPYASKLLQHPTIAACVRARARAVMSEHETIEELATFIRNGPIHPIERAPWHKAIETMLKYHGALTDKVEHSGVIESQVKMVTITVTASEPAQVIEGTHARTHARAEDEDSRE